MAGELSLTCPNCGERFPSALQIDEATFEVLRLGAHFECCRKCAFAHRYVKADYYFFELAPE